MRITTTTTNNCVMGTAAKAESGGVLREGWVLWTGWALQNGGKLRKGQILRIGRFLRKDWGLQKVRILRTGWLRSGWIGVATGTILLGGIGLYSFWGNGDGMQANGTGKNDGTEGVGGTRTSDSIAQNTPDNTVDEYFLTGRNGLSQSKVVFRDVPGEYCTKPMQLQPEVIEAFGKMRRAAAGAGIAFKILSGRRTYEQQKGIWTNKWNKLQSRGIHGVDAVEQILRFSSMPGSSRHHWGTDIDLNSLEPAYFTSAKGAKELAWLRANAGNYGFAEVYSPRSTGRKNGYQPEPWHWSYMPLASSYLAQYKQKIGYTHFGIPDSINSNTNQPTKSAALPAETKQTLNPQTMVFPGSQHAKSVKIIENYVGGVYDNGLWKKPK